jgi:mono/diheme cytochrome c family protein
LALCLLAAPASADRIADGRYQSVLGDCEGCHTAPGGKPFAGGVELATPFGTLVTSNITQDKETGIGNWSEADFRRALKTGVAPGGKRLYPAMPYPAYARMSDADVSVLWAYMKSIAPVRKVVDANRLRFPFNVRATVIAWNWLNFRPEPFKPDSTKSAAWNRGAYLVTGPAHCGMCHTPKSLTGGDARGAGLVGASLQGWLAPDITAHGVTGLGGWTRGDIVRFLRTGWSRHGTASGPMAEVIENSTAKMTDADLNAMAVYLKDLPASPALSSPALARSDVRMVAGEAVYLANCVACHGRDGAGQAMIFPPLARVPMVQQANIETLARVILAGARATQTKAAPTAPAMPSFAWRLDDRQAADVLTYIRNSWGNKATPVTPDEIRAIRGRLRGGS